MSFNVFSHILMFNVLVFANLFSNHCNWLFCVLLSWGFEALPRSLYPYLKKFPFLKGPIHLFMVSVILYWVLISYFSYYQNMWLIPFNDENFDQLHFFASGCSDALQPGERGPEVGAGVEVEGPRVQVRGRVEATSRSSETGKRREAARTQVWEDH